MSIRSNRGATLVELMTSIAIFGIIAAAALGLLLYATNVNSDITAEVIETNRVYQTLDFMKNKVSESTEVSALIIDESDVGIQTDPGADNSFKDKFEFRESNLYYIPEIGEQILLVEGIQTYTVSIGGDNKHATISFTTTGGNNYTVTVSCKNG